MFSFHMCIECFLTYKLQVAWHTCKGLVHFVNHLVTLQLVLPSKRLSTVLTHKRSFPSVDNSMPSKFVLSSVTLTAHNTNIRALSCVDPSVDTQSLGAEESLATSVTMEGKVVRVGANVILQLVTSRENFSTNVTDFLSIPTSSSSSLSFMAVMGHVGGEWC